MPQKLRHFHICYSTWQGHVEGARFTLYFRLLIKICKQIFISQRFTNHDLASAKAVAIVIQPHVFLNQENNQTKKVWLFSWPESGCWNQTLYQVLSSIDIQEIHRLLDED
jgi:hypothetical protein